MAFSHTAFTNVARLAVVMAAGTLLLAACSTGSAGETSQARNLAEAGSVPLKVVSLGDSYISGEAGRWAGNSNGYTNLGGDKDAAARTDLGKAVYFDAGAAETIPNCHRSRSAEVHVGNGWDSINLACSGAQTVSIAKDHEGNYKPGIDATGQLGLLSAAAKESTPIGAVVMSIGGNDVGFGPILTTCITGFMTSVHLAKSLCSEDSKVTRRVSAGAMSTVQDNIAGAISRVLETMREAGYGDDEWALIVQNYPDPVSPSTSIRYGTGSRQLYGGCPFWNEDLDWVHSTLLPELNGAVAAGIAEAQQATGKDILTLDISHVFDGRRLCELGTALAEEATNDDKLRAKAERVQQVVLSEVVYDTPYDMQETLHPNFYGQRALSNCLLQALNDGHPRSGTCSAPADWSAVSDSDQPQMTFTVLP